MSKDATPKLDRLREMREANFERAQAAARATVPKLRAEIEEIRARPPRVKTARKKRR